MKAAHISPAPIEAFISPGVLGGHNRWHEVAICAGQCGGETTFYLTDVGDGRVCEECRVAFDYLLELGLAHVGTVNVNGEDLPIAIWNKGVARGGQVDPPLWPDVRDENIYSAVVIGHGGGQSWWFTVPAGQSIPHLTSLTNASELGEHVR